MNSYCKITPASGISTPAAQLRRLERIMRERKGKLISSEAARIQLAIDDLKRVVDRKAM